MGSNHEKIEVKHLVTHSRLLTTNKNKFAYFIIKSNSLITVFIHLLYNVQYCTGAAVSSKVVKVITLVYYI